MTDSFDLYCRTRGCSLTLNDLKLLNTYIKSRWARFVSRAPEAWRTDGWMDNHSPISMFLRFGQNQNLGALDEDDRNHEAMEFEKTRDYTQIRFLSMALATQTMCVYSHFIRMSLRNI